MRLNIFQKRALARWAKGLTILFLIGASLHLSSVEAQCEAKGNPWGQCSGRS